MKQENEKPKQNKENCNAASLVPDHCVVNGPRTISESDAPLTQAGSGPVRASDVRISFILDGSCQTCARLAKGEMCPPHDASPRCESGKRNHCSCDVCF